MEGFQNNIESTESLAQWESLREQAPAKANELIESIDGFPDIEAGEQVAALTVLLDTLALHNENRYIAREIGLLRERIREVDRHEQKMVALGVTA